MPLSGKPGTVVWKASKQDTFTISTTEAELLALDQATKEALYARRPINERKRHTKQPWLDRVCELKSPGTPHDGDESTQQLLQMEVHQRL